MREFWQVEAGQSTAEYALAMCALVIPFIAVAGHLREGLFRLLQYLTGTVSVWVIGV